MSPNPPVSPEGSSLPSRHRPALGNLAKDTTEIDLWALDDDLDPDVGALPGKPIEPGGKRNVILPAARESDDKPSRMTDASTVVPPPAESRITMNVRKQGSKAAAVGEIMGPARPERDFDDLEQWEDVPQEPELEELPDIHPFEVHTDDLTEIQVEKQPEEVVPPAPQPADPVPEETSSTDPVAEDDVFSPVPKQGTVQKSLRPRLGLSKVERGGIIALLVLLTVCGLLVYGFSIHRIPTESSTGNTNDFPIKGKHVVLDSVVSYWRAPVTDGPSPDVFRRGSVLLPIVEFAVSGGHGAIRVVFRDDNRIAVGDSIIRAIQGRGQIKVTGTAGFEDMGMYAAYRTGGKKPWTIEVLEGPSPDASSTEFKKLFDMNLSVETR